MGYKRVLSVQDISCLGQCSTTVALPILSAWGQEVCILPTALLSTHTGGFGGPAVFSLAHTVGPILDHWKAQGITFDCILLGYLGTLEALDLAERILAEMLAPGGFVILDPAMADRGKLYSGLDRAYARRMKELAAKADLLLPNITELEIFTGMTCPEDPAAADLEAMLRTLGHGRVVLTGVGFGPEETGAALWDGRTLRHYGCRKLSGSYHGTGDMFAACFAGALLRGMGEYEAMAAASEFVAKAIACTLADPVHPYGVKFEQALPEILRFLKETS